MSHDPRFGFVPPGHRAVMGIPVLHAWPHPSGAWLSTQAIGRAVGLFWRPSDSWRATICCVAVFDELPTFEENYGVAYRCGEFLVNEGPPPALLASAAKSAQVRKEKATAAANQRWDKMRASKVTNSPNAEMDDAALLQHGPPVDRRKWHWEQKSADTEWNLFLIEDSETNIYCYQESDGNKWSLTRWWCPVGKNGHESEDVLNSTSLAKCFSVIEEMAARDPGTWKRGEKH